jgi:hypothetical protein
LFFERLTVLDTRGEVTNLATGLKTSIAVHPGDYAQVLYCENSGQFVFLHRHGGFVTIVPCTRGHVAHRGSPIACMAAVGPDLVATAGSDYLVYLWGVPEFALVGTISVHAPQIVAIAGNSLLGVVACFARGGRIFVCLVKEMKAVWSFDTKLNTDVRHRLELLDNGALAITCEDETAVAFFSLQGAMLGKVAFDSGICRLLTVVTRAYEAFVVASLKNRKVAVVSCADCASVTVLDEAVHPELVAVVPDSRRLVVVPISGNRHPVIRRF